MSGATFYLLLKNSSNGQEYLLSPQGFFSLSANETKSVTWSGSAPTTCSFPLTGTYTVKVHLDPLQEVSNEINAGNNSVLTTNSTIVKRKDAGCTDGSTFPDYDTDGISDADEIYGGSNPTIADKKPLYDSNAKKYTATPSDVSANTYGADPVNLRTGGLELVQSDFSLQGRGIPLHLLRTYNSTVTERNHRFGRGWSYSYHSFYYQDSTSKHVEVYHGGALVSFFTTTDGGITFTAAPGESGTLVNENTVLVYRTLNETTYQFSKKLTNNLGILEKITDSHGNVTDMRDPSKQ